VWSLQLLLAGQFWREQSYWPLDSIGSPQSPANNVNHFIKIKIILKQGKEMQTSSWPCHASLWDSVIAWMRNISVPKNYGFDTITWLLLQVALSHTPPLQVLEVHINSIMGISIHIIESKIHISYSENHDSTLFLYYFYISPLPTLDHIVAKGR
jgi:hypothetical protein